MTIDMVFLIINMLITFVSCVGAYKSIRYFKKSRHITTLTQTKQALAEIEEMLIKLP